jgi:hypothetical protein
MHAKWENLRELPTVRALYSADEPETGRLPFAVRDALGDSLHLEKLPKESASARSAFLKAISASLKQDEAAKKQWTDWVTSQSSVPAERSKAIMQVLTTSMEEEAAAAQRDALEQHETTQQYEPELSKDEDEEKKTPAVKQEVDEDDRSYEVLIPQLGSEIAPSSAVKSLVDFLESYA